MRILAGSQQTVHVERIFLVQGLRSELASLQRSRRLEFTLIEEDVFIQGQRVESKLIAVICLATGVL